MILILTTEGKDVATVIANNIVSGWWYASFILHCEKNNKI